MKRIFLLLLAAAATLTASAQHKPYTRDSSLSRWVIDLNFLGGGYNQDMTLANTSGNYLNGHNVNTGTVGFNNGAAFGGDAQVGFFFGHRRHWGIGTGLLYLRETGNLDLNGYHAEYQATDAGGNIYRQIVSGDNIREKLTIDNFNIPLVLKYKARFSKHWGFTADAGALFNLQMKNSYNTNATLNYEAAYQFNAEGATVYDNAPTPATTDFLITRAQYIKNNMNGDVNQYFVQKRSEGYNVGLGVPTTNNKGSVSYSAGSVGFLVQPSFNYFFSDHVALNFGGYYLFQPFTNSANANYKLTNGTMGDYNSVQNSVTKSNNQSYGVNVGLRFFLGHKRVPPAITFVDQAAPSMCGACDGSITLHGLFPNDPVTVNYNANGNAKPAYAGNADANGTVRVTGLCAGTYTDIVATEHKGRAMTTAVTLADPVLRIASQNSTNPSASGACDGTITLYGLFAGKAVTVNYNLNGSSQTSWSGTVGSDNSVTFTGLCAGTYSNIVASVSNCTANGTDITLTAPAPPPPPPPAPVVEEKTDISTPLLFDFNKATIHRSSYPTLEDATKLMMEDKTATLKVDAHTDAIGSASYNQKLSVRRAAAVKTYLKKKGVNPKRIKTYGHGKTEPVAPNDTEEGRAKNRRAVMTLEEKK